MAYLLSFDQYSLNEPFLYLLSAALSTWWTNPWRPKKTPENSAGEAPSVFGLDSTESGDDDFAFDASAFKSQKRNNAENPFAWMNDRGSSNSDRDSWGDRQPSSFDDAPAKAWPEESVADDKDALAELNDMIGLDAVKEQIARLRAKIVFDQRRRAGGFRTSNQSLHMVFTGNSGTGKTTVARIVGKIFYELGILDRPSVHEVTRSDLVAGYIGQTAIKTAAEIKKALGGVLFIDEAYSLAKLDGGQDFGAEAIETLLSEMENQRGNLCVIVAGYEREMGRFLRSNIGLPSRFKTTIRFPDYSPLELYRIFEKTCSDDGFSLTRDAMGLAADHLEAIYETRGQHFGNGREVRNLFADCYNNAAFRTADDPSLDISTMEAADIPMPDVVKQDRMRLQMWLVVRDPSTTKTEKQKALSWLEANPIKKTVKRIAKIQ